MTTLEPDNSIELASGVSVRTDALRYAFSRSGGPGGQAVNKLSTKAELRVAVTAIEGLTEAMVTRLRSLAGSRLTQDDDILIVAETHRSQLDNKEACLTKLKALVLDATRVPKPRKKTRPSRGQVEKRLEQKRRRSDTKRSRRRPADE